MINKRKNFYVRCAIRTLKELNKFDKYGKECITIIEKYIYDTYDEFYPHLFFVNTDVFEDDVDSITAKGVRGSFGILPNHVPFMSTLAIDTAKVVKDGEEIFFSIIGGAFQFKKNEANESETFIILHNMMVSIY